MEKREILIANTRDQNKYRVVTDATTLRELQDVLTRNEGVYKMVGGSWVSNIGRIDIEGLTFTEGISKTQLLSRDSMLPTNVMFKGQPTNNLVMMLTNTNKQIRSGAYPVNRKEFGDYIKKNNLGEAIKAEFGDNWTRVATDKLVNFFANTVEKNTAVNNEELANVRKELENLPETKMTPVLPDIKTAPHANTVNWIYDGIKQMVNDLLLHVDDVVVLTNQLIELSQRLLEVQPIVTVNDVDDMLDSMGY